MERFPKYVSHIFRTALLYWAVALIYFFLGYGLVLNAKFWWGLVFFTAGYAGVYFLNDSADVKEDERHGKANLYALLRPRGFFWAVAGLLFTLGLVYAAALPDPAGLLFILLYLLNAGYSLPPLRFKDRDLRKEFTIAAIYFLKYMLISVYLGHAVRQFPWMVFLFGAVYAGFLESVYKRHIRPNLANETLFLSGALFLFAGSVMAYPGLFLVLLPLPLLGFLLIFAHADRKIPIHWYEFGYALWLILLWGVFG